MEYRVIYTDQEDLEHGLFGRKGSQKKNHKYLMREWVNDKWKYYYTQAQIQAKKLGKKISKEAKSVQKDISKAVKNGGKEAKKSISKAISNGKKKVDRALKNLNKTSTKALKDAKKQIDKGKKTVQNIIENGPPGYYSVQELKNGNRSMWGGASDEAFAKAHKKAAGSDIATGFKNAAKEIGKGFKKAGQDLADSRYYKNGDKIRTSSVNKVIDNLVLDSKGYNPANYDWETTYSGWHKSATEAKKAYKESKKKK